MSSNVPERPTPLTFNAGGVPDALRERDQWVCWRYQFDGDRDEWTKAPIKPYDSRDGVKENVDTDHEENGEPEKSHDYAGSTWKHTWRSFSDAVEFHERSGTDTDGLGFVVSEDDLLVGIDGDDCRNPETDEFEDWASDILDSVRTYGEVSPSGTGMRLFGFGFIPGDRTRADIEDAAGHLEMYETARYLTVTGQHIHETPDDVRQVNDEIGEVHGAYIADDSDAKSQARAANGGAEARPQGSNPGGNVSGTDSLTDAELLDRAKNAENGEKFRRLWNGDASGYPSGSEADLALVGLLAFWTGGDRSRIDDLYRQSGLMRDKWERDDYRERTIDKALSGRSDFYEPSSGTDTPPPLDEPENVTEDTTGENERLGLEPTSVRAVAGLGEDGDVSDLNDRQRAACVWDLILQSDEYHVRVHRDTGVLWAYDGGIWNRDGERELRHAARQALGSMNYGQNVLAELKAQARSDPRAEVPADEFGLSPGELAIENGLLDLDAAADGEDGALRELRPDDYALTRLPVEYDPAAEYDEWNALVEEWAENGRADALQEYVGYCLHIGALPIHRALLLVGSGANGKGTFLSVVRTLLGSENTSSIELQTLANESDAVADFYGALANIDDDLSARSLGKGLGMFKKLVGGDRVRGRKLYEPGFEFDATGKHLYAANEVPDVNVPDNDEAFWRRWLLIEFPNHYPPHERDPTLRDKLSEPEALSGVLSWAIAGRTRLLEQGYFTNENEFAHEKRERWQAWGESVDKFISECIERDPDAERITTGDAHRRYAAWCRENSEDPVGQRELTTKLKNEDVGYKSSIRIDGKVERGYGALGFSSDVPAVEDTPERREPGDDRPKDWF